MVIDVLVILILISGGGVLHDPPAVALVNDASVTLVIDVSVTWISGWGPEGDPPGGWQSALPGIGAPAVLAGKVAPLDGHVCHQPGHGQGRPVLPHPCSPGHPGLPAWVQICRRTQGAAMGSGGGHCGALGK